MRLRELMDGLHVPAPELPDLMPTEKPCACPVFVPDLRQPDDSWVCAGCGWGKP
jgi:hypothetical protein